MHDENGNQCAEESFAIPTCIFLVSGRPLKRSKSINKTHSHCINLSPTPSLVDINSNHESSLPISWRRSSQLVELTPSGSFEKFPTELIFYLLDFMPLTSIGKLGQTSKHMRNILIQWFVSSCMQNRFMAPFLRTPITSSDKEWVGRLSLPDELELACKRTGVLIKQLTCLFPTSQRVKLYHQFITKAKHGILQRRPDFEPVLIAAASGIILHSIISGWDKRECVKVHATIYNLNNIGYMLSEFLKNPVSANVKVEQNLRLIIRSLFLDFCSYSDRSIWIEIVFDCPELSQHVDLAKLLLLLYTPLQTEGSVLRDFFEREVGSSFYPEDWKLFGETLAFILSSSKRRNSSNEAVDIIQTITGLPTLWSPRSLGALLLCIHCVDCKPVITYFKHLSSNDQMGMAIEILSNIFYMAPEFIASRNLDILGFSYRSLFNLIRNAINCGWDTEDRQTLVQELWSDIRETSDILLEDAIFLGNTEELHNLMKTWKEICIHLTF